MEGADFDTHRTAVVDGEIGEAFGVVEHGYQSALMLDGLIVERTRWTVADAAAAALAEIQHPGVLGSVDDGSRLGLLW